MRSLPWCGVLLLVGCLSAKPEIEGGYLHETQGGTTAATTGQTMGSGASSGGAASTASSSGTTRGGTGGRTSGTTGGSGTATSSGHGTGGCSNFCDCGPSQVELTGSLVNFCANGAPVTTQVQISAVGDPSITAVSDAAGAFHICAAPGTALALQFQAPGFVTANYETIALQQSAAIGAPGVPLVCASAVSLLGAVLPGFDASKAVLLVIVSPKGTQAACVRRGWSFSLSAAGQPVAASTAFVKGQGIDATATSTTNDGIEILYDIDPAASPVQVTGTNATVVLADGGDLCPDVGSSPPTQLTGAVPVVGAEVSYAPFVLP